MVGVAGAVLYLVVIPAALVVAFVLGGIDHYARIDQGRQAHQGLCALKLNYQQRVRDGDAFLQSHPNGIADIPAAVIRNSLDNQRQTVAALAVIDCTKEGTP